MSALVVCLICDRTRILFWAKNALRCSNCGVPDPRVILDTDHKAWTGDYELKDGLPKIEAMRRTYGMLKWIRDTKNFKPKWPDAKFRDIFGCWPPKEIENAPDDPPTAGLLRIIHIGNQRWKKAKKEQERLKIITADPDPLQRVQEGVPSFMTETDWDVRL